MTKYFDRFGILDSESVPVYKEIKDINNDVKIY